MKRTLLRLCVCVCVQKLRDAGVEIPEVGGKAKSSAEEESKTLKEEVRRLKDELEATKKGMSQLAETRLHPGLRGMRERTRAHSNEEMCDADGFNEVRRCTLRTDRQCLVCFC